MRRLSSSMFAISMALSVFASPKSALARVPLVDSAVGHAIDAVLTLVGHSNLSPAQPYQVLSDPQLESRAAAAVANVRVHSGVRFRYSRTRVVLVAGRPGEPNAFCTGPTIYVSRGLVSSLDDRELVAVVAHEMAHAEQGHLLQRMGFDFASILIQFGRLVQSDAVLIATGRADAFMRELQSLGHWKMIENALESGSLAQELQADCFAYQWLAHMRDLGLANQPEDVARAQLALLGLTAAMVQDDPVMGPRVRAILSGADAAGRCD